jgi:D-beta-D-heptose 7-phosphate kinase / D-beta-D-heptose 1-phosphate adenosyltransferase
MTDITLIDRIEAERAARILIVGDVMLDRFIYGSAERVSPEAPVPVLRFERESVMPGGAANVARNAVALGAQVELIGLLGADSSGAEFRALVSNQPGWRLNLVESKHRPTTTKSRLIADRQQIVRLDIEDSAPATREEIEALVSAIRSAITRAQVLVLSDYAKGTLVEPVVRAAIDAAHAQGIPILVDPKTPHFERYRGASVVKPNLAEFARAVGHPCPTDQSVIEAAEALLDSAGLGALLVTRGEHGMTLVSRASPPHHLPTVARQVFDVSGAGDTVAAVIAVLLAEGASLPDGAFAANLAAGLVVEKLGTATVTRDELASELRRQFEDHRDRKIATLERAIRQRRAWAAGGNSVVFTNGCFDLLHPGHISLLRQARAAGHRLVVGVNSDASVKRLKGPERPIRDQAARSLVLSELDSVDLVVIFDEDTPLALIEALRPDVLVKGADYRPDQVVGWPLVESYGGKLVLAALEPNQSTTATIARLRG